MLSSWGDLFVRFLKSKKTVDLGQWLEIFRHPFGALEQDIVKADIEIPQLLLFLYFHS
jgi:hypothetical protein